MFAYPSNTWQHNNRKRLGRYARRLHGLTLIELTVAMAVGAVIVLASLQAFQQGRFVQSRIDTLMNNSGRQYDLWRLMARDVVSSFVLQSEEQTGIWTGKSDSMRFLAVQPAGRPMQVEYAFVKSEAAARLGTLVRSTRLCSGSVPIGQLDPVTVAEGIEQFEVRYGQMAEGSDDLIWTTEYQGSERPPLAVEVRLTWSAGTAGKQRAHWVMPVRVEMPAAPARGPS